MLELRPEKIAEAFPAYRPDGVGSELMIENLLAKLEDREFCADVDAMARAGAPDYDPQAAGRMVIERIFGLMD